jgi:hypothetical protein
VRSGDKYVVNGQKVWISTAQVCEKILLLARTMPLGEVKNPTHGLSLFYTNFDRSQVAVHEIEMMGRKAVDSNELKSAEFSVLFCIFSLPDMITRTAVGEPQVRRKPVISRNGRLTGRFSLPFLRSLPVSAFLSNPLLTRVPSGACRSLSYAAPSLIFSRTPRKWVPSRNSYSPCKTRIIWGFPPRVRQGKRHS